jgi:hypothetical protein
VSILQRNSDADGVEIKWFESATWDNLLDGMLAFANLFVLRNQFSLIDVGFTSTCVEDKGGKPRGWVVFNRAKQFSGNREIRLIKHKVGSYDWDPFVQWLNETVKSVSNRFFRHVYAPTVAQNHDQWLLTVWHWSKPQTGWTSEDVEVF